MKNTTFPWLADAIESAMKTAKLGERVIIHRPTTSKKKHKNSPKCFCNPLIMEVGNKKMTKEEIYMAVEYLELIHLRSNNKLPS